MTVKDPWLTCQSTIDLPELPMQTMFQANQGGSQVNIDTIWGIIGLPRRLAFLKTADWKTLKILNVNVKEVKIA